MKGWYDFLKDGWWNPHSEAPNYSGIQVAFPNVMCGLGNQIRRGLLTAEHIDMKF